jgi:DNA-binding LacI/PurR family transcriptional regulator
MTKPSQAKMKDVAERAGVSLMTVSLALRTDHTSNRLSEKTRQRILEIARELSYSPNARGRILRSGVTNVIGFYTGRGFAEINLPFFTEVLSGLQEGCDIFGKDLLLHGTFKNRSADNIFSELRDGRVDGLVVHLPLDHALGPMLPNSHLPVVAIVNAVPGIPSIIVDDECGGHLIAAHLADRGYKKCLYIQPQVAPESVNRRLKGFEDGALKHGIAVEEYFPALTETYEEILVKWAARDKKTRPNVIVCWNDHAAYTFLAHCRRLNISVPEDLAITGFDGSPTPYEHFWSLTTVRASWFDVAEMAVEQLNKIIAGEEVQEKTVLPVTLVKGHTC